MIAIAGGSGKIALLLTQRLAARGETVAGLIRNPERAGDVRAHGGRPVVVDLERAGVPEIERGVAGASAVVFAAGAGPGSGPERKLTMDRDGAIKLLEAASAAGVRRYLMVSSIGAESPPDGDDDVFSVYLRAKAQADAALRAGDRAWTIVRPGPLSDDPATGRVRVDAEPFRAEIPRADVAAVLDALLQDPRAARRTLYLGAGEARIDQALDAVLGGGGA